MEITARPRRLRLLVRLVRIALTAGVLASVALLVPPALGLQTHVVGDGSLVFEEQTPTGSWRVAPEEVGRVVFSVPMLGYPLLAADARSVPPWAPAGSLLVLAGGLVLMRRRTGVRDATRRPVVEAAPVTEVVTDVVTVVPPLGRAG